jgi:YidC/Oxa1 family membrane protein insertase
MDKRVLLTVAVCMGILFVWTKFFVPHQTPEPQAQQPQAQQPQAQQPAQPPAAPAPPVAAAAPAGEQPKTPAAPTKRKPGEPAVAAPAAPVGAPVVPPKEKAPAQTSMHEEPGLYKTEFTTWGAAPQSFVLLDKQYLESAVQPDGKKGLRPINLVRTTGAQLPMIVQFPESDFTVPPDDAWIKLQQSENELVYVWENEQVRIEKRFTFVPKTYEVQLKVTLENKTEKPLGEHLQLQMVSHQDPNVKPGGMFSQRFAQTEGECHVNGKLKRADLQSLLKKNVDEVGVVRWVGTDEKYFVAAMAQPQIPNEQQRCWVNATTDGIISANLLQAERKIPAKGKTEYLFGAFVGPKLLHMLDAVKVGGEDAKLGDAVNYGWTEAIARPMLAVLKAIHRVVPNWGVAIILLTILLKAITWWPTTRSMRSMKEMARLKPEVDKLKERYGDDKQKFNMAVMALYKERGINPLGGCLPMLIQMPIYIALYSMLGNSVELYRSGFLGWITDLTGPDPYYITPALTGVLMFVQQKTAPQSPDNAQAKAMMYTMPLMFTAFSIFLPSGLTIYILTNTVLTFVQQYWLNRGGQGPVGRPAPRPAKAAKA